MTDKNYKILELIKEKVSIEDICKQLNISEKQLFVRIKQIINDGYQVNPVFNYSSSNNYKMYNNEDFDKNKIIIHSKNEEHLFNFLVVSDLHTGNKNSNLDYMNMVYEYAKNKNIKYILNCGDIIEGDYTTQEKNISTVEAQVEYLIKNHPYDTSIKNVMIFGNHDYHSLIKNGYDVSKVINNSRCDFISLGYGQGNVNIKNDSFILFHKLNENFKPVSKFNENIIISGHGHMMKTKFKDQLWICVPSLSNVSTDKTLETVPGFIDLSIDLIDKKIDYIQVKHLVINPKITQVSESRCKVKTLFK